MSSGFSGGVPDFFSAGRRPTIFPNNGSYTTNNLTTQPQQFPFRSQLAGILPDPNSQIHRPGSIGKRSLAEFQQQQSFLQNYLRNVRPRPNYSPISPLSPVDFPSPDASINPRYGLPILQQHKLQPFSNFAQNKGVTLEGSGQDQTEKKNIMNHRLQELEKELLGEDEDDNGEEGVSVVTNSEWSDTIKNLLSPAGKPISPSPTSSSSSSCCTTSASPQFPNPKQAFMDAAAAISDGKPETAAEILARLLQVGNSGGSSEQRLVAYMASALKPRVSPSGDDTAAVYGDEHAASTQMLYDVSPCFKLGFMAANLAILEAVSEKGLEKVHVLDFDIGRGGQYVHLLHALAAKRKLENRRAAAVLKLTAFTDFSTTGEENKLNVVGEGLKSLANKIGVSFSFDIRNLNTNELCLEKLEIQSDEAVAVNFGFKLYKLPDESVSTENLRDDLLRRVKRLSPAVVTVVEQELNTNTATLTSRVRDVYEYYASLFDSLDSTLSRESPERVRIESGLGRRMGNSVAREGRERVERCEVFGKWRARMSMAGFGLVPVSRLAVDSLRSKVEAGTRGNPGFSVNEESGGIRFGWMGRTLTVASAWR